jgi:hypothetical protein
MRLARPIAALALTALLAGCSTADLRGPTWAKSGVTVQEATLDTLQCRRAADQIDSEPGTWVGGVADAAWFVIAESSRQRSFQRCMTAKGYEPSR